MKHLTLAAAILAASTSLASARSTGLQWASLTIFTGQGITQQGHHGTIFNAGIVSTTPDSTGRYELFFNITNQALSDFAGVNADQARAAASEIGGERAGPVLAKACGLVAVAAE